MDDREYVETSIRTNPAMLKQRFDRSRHVAWHKSAGTCGRMCNRIEIAKILIAADPSLVTAGQAEGNAPMDLLVKPWHHSALGSRTAETFLRSID